MRAPSSLRKLQSFTLTHLQSSSDRPGHVMIFLLEEKCGFSKDELGRQVGAGGKAIAFRTEQLFYPNSTIN